MALRDVLDRLDVIELRDRAGRRTGDGGGEGGIGRTATPRSTRTSHDLRLGSSDLLDRRRQVAGLQLVATGLFGAVAAYQSGLIRHLPEPPLDALDADAVDASGEAYTPMSVPDSVLGMASAVASLALATMGPDGRHRSRPWIPLLLAAKAAFDVASSGYLFAEQKTKHGRFCGWCLAASAVLLAAAPLTIPEARAALRDRRS